MLTIKKGSFKGMNSAILENSDLIVTVLEYGGKISSIYHKSLNKEFLYQSKNDKYIMNQYGDAFSNGESSGFDDMFPTIDECIYPQYPFTNTTLPDHGEVWSIPWDLKFLDDSIELKVHGVRLPYLLEKKIFIIDEKIRLEYKALNLSIYPFSFIWAAHPLFNCMPGTRIEVKDGTKIINVQDFSPRLGRYGETHNWSKATSKNGDTYDLSKIRSKEFRSCDKYYFTNELSLGYASIIDNNSRIDLKYPVNKVPYLGVWINEGGFMGQYNVALEPCTGLMDSLDIAMKANRVSVLEPSKPYEWYLEMEFTKN